MRHRGRAPRLSRQRPRGHRHYCVYASRLCHPPCGLGGGFVDRWLTHRPRKQVRPRDSAAELLDRCLTGYVCASRARQRLGDAEGGATRRAAAQGGRSCGWPLVQSSESMRRMRRDPTRGTRQEANAPRNDESPADIGRAWAVFGCTHSVARRVETLETLSGAACSRPARKCRACPACPRDCDPPPIVRPPSAGRTASDTASSVRGQRATGSHTGCRECGIRTVSARAMSR